MGLIIERTGWTVQEVDATPWPDMLDLLIYWKKRHQAASGQVNRNPTEDELRQAIEGL